MPKCMQNSLKYALKNKSTGILTYSLVHYNVKVYCIGIIQFLLICDGNSF